MDKVGNMVSTPLVRRIAIDLVRTRSALCH
jgi:hypothetical protein